MIARSFVSIALVAALGADLAAAASNPAPSTPLSATAPAAASSSGQAPDPINDPSVKTVFPAFTITRAPEGRGLVAERPGRAPEKLLNPADLRAFVSRELPPVKTEDQARTAALAWLALSAAAHGQDDLFGADRVVDAKPMGGGWKAEGKATARAGANRSGELSVSLGFDAQGKLVSSSSASSSASSSSSNRAAGASSSSSSSSASSSSRVSVRK